MPAFLGTNPWAQLPQSQDEAFKMQAHEPHLKGLPRKGMRVEGGVVPAIGHFKGAILKRETVPSLGTPAGQFQST